MHFDINLVIIKMHENKLILKKLYLKAHLKQKTRLKKTF
jgi:hypothetical protein